MTLHRHAHFEMQIRGTPLFNLTAKKGIIPFCLLMISLVFNLISIKRIKNCLTKLKNVFLFRF